MDEKELVELPLYIQEKLAVVYKRAAHPEEKLLRKIIDKQKESDGWMTDPDPFNSLPEVKPSHDLGKPGGDPGTVELEKLDKWVGPDHQLREAGYDYRPAQADMARLITKGFNSGQPVLVEAPTGTGKGMAYLSAAFEWNRKTGRRVIISTCTKTLQDQLINQDLPVLNRFADKKLKAAVLKGMPNYICLRKLMRLTDRKQFSREEAEKLKDIFISVYNNQGDLDKFGSQPFGEELRALPATRLYGDCPHYRKCFVSRVYSKASEAEIIVMNHALFLSLAQRVDGVFPGREVIIDEAHHLPAVAEDIFGFNVPRWQWPYWRKRLGTRSFFYKQLKQASGILSEKSSENLSSWKFRLDELSELWDFFWQGIEEFGGGNWPIKLHHRTKWRRRLEKETKLAALREQLEFWTGCLYRLEKDLGKPLPHLSADASFRREGLQEMYKNISEFFNPAPDEENVRWIEGNGRFALNLAPLDCSNRLSDILTDTCRSSVLTSATLSVDADFSYFRKKIGLLRGGFQKSLPSPFDFKTQARFYMVEDGPDPRRRKKYQEYLVDCINSICRRHRGRTLVLFTSYRTMRPVVKKCRDQLDYSLLVQGEGGGRGELLEKMQSEPESVLFGTGTFWEGVDVPGQSLEAVVVTRLPFPVPDDPMIEARSWKLEAEGKNPFRHLMLPEAVLTFRQGIGRLIRTREDRGKIYCLDSRCAKKSYGSHFLRGLPPDLQKIKLTTAQLKQNSE